MQDKSGNEFDPEVCAEPPYGCGKSGVGLNTSRWLNHIRITDVEYQVKPKIEKWVKLFEFGDRQVLVTKALNADGVPAVRLETAADSLEHSISTEFTFDEIESFDEQWANVDLAFNDVTRDFAFKRINGILGMFGKRMTEDGEIIKND